MAPHLPPCSSPWLLACAAALTACTVDEIPETIGTTPEGSGPRVRHELYPEDLTSLPLPNDLLAVPDPTSDSGLRLNVATEAASPIEESLRQAVNQLDGWGLLAPITVAFEQREDGTPAVDLIELRARHAPDRRDPRDDALYVINLRTGTPVPLELGPGSYQFLARDKSLFPAYAPRALEPAVEIETADERADPTSGQVDPTLVEYSTASDSDFDGWFDRPNVLRPTPCATPERVRNGEITELVRDTCLADSLAPWYERETDTLVVRPLIPLEAQTRYAVVLTDRLVDPSGEPIRSPFASVYHPADITVAPRVEAILRQAEGHAWFGDLAGTGLEHVAFLWAFTTGSPADELVAVRDGLSGVGDFGQLATDYPAELRAARTVGLVSESDREAGDAPPAGWKRSASCAPLVNRPFLVDGAVAAQAVSSATLEELGLLSDRDRAQVVSSLETLDYLVLAEYSSPFLIAGGAASPDVSSAFQLARSDGDPHATTDRVQAWIFVPRTSPDSPGPPFDVAIYAHSTGGSVVEALPLAGALARQGLATVAYQAPWHGPDRSARALTSAIMSDCYRRGWDAAQATRAVDLDGDGALDDELGARVATAHVQHGRDVVRQTVIDGMQLLRALSRFDGTRTGDDYNDDGLPDLAGDFNADGRVDLGGPDATYTAWGQSLGGHVATLLGPLEPQIQAVAAIGNWSSLVDGWTRTGTPRSHATFFGAWLGPWFVGVPESDLDGRPTRCLPSEISLRVGGLVGGQLVEAEFHCLALRELTDSAGLPNGGTVVVSNVTRRERRCARLGPAGRFWIPFPAAVDDVLQLTVLDKPDAAATYAPGDGCALVADAKPIAKIFTWGDGTVPPGSEDESGLVVCDAERGCSRFGDRYYPAGAPLLAPAAGAGLRRGTPELRRLLELARHVTASADAVTYAPHYAVNPFSSPVGAPGSPTAALLVVPLAAREIPVDVQVSTARAMGLVPFVTEQSITGRPEWAEYAVPQRLFEELSGVTPNRLLVSSSVLEALPYLERAIPPGDCEANELSVAEAPSCHADCVEDSDCPIGQKCDLELGRCRTPAPDPAVCRRAQFDVDALDEGQTRFGEREAPVPLRLTRVAAPVADLGLDEVWAPRLLGPPHGTDLGAWAADKPTLALVMPYLDVAGRDRLAAPQSCASFDTDRYLANLIGRFLATGGWDPYYVSHPSTHRCLENGTCQFFQ